MRNHERHTAKTSVSLTKGKTEGYDVIKSKEKKSREDSTEWINVLTTDKKGYGNQWNQAKQ